MKRLLETLFLLCVGGMIGFFIRSVVYTDTSSPLQVIKGNTNFPYISHRLDSESLTETTQGQIAIIKNNINGYIESQTANGKVRKVAVYYRDLNNGPWMGINEKEGFSPASLLKVPIMLSIYKKADADRSFLQKELHYQPVDDGVTQDYVPSIKLRKDGTYTISELVKRMIVYSDNEAKNILLKEMTEEELDRVYKDLGMAIPGIVSLNDTVSVRSYASFFRVLYNGSYLSRELSNKALELLTQIEFTDGLVAGVPRQIKVAHKFGERAYTDGVKQLHDCGVVYYPETPYILCVMTQGGDWKELSHTIQGISKIVYKELTSLK